MFRGQNVDKIPIADIVVGDLVLLQVSRTPFLFEQLFFGSSCLCVLVIAVRYGVVEVLNLCLRVFISLAIVFLRMVKCLAGLLMSTKDHS